MANAGTKFTPMPVAFETTQETRFCRDCKWCELWARSPEESRCTAPQTYTETISPITGATVRKHEWAYCATHRAHDQSSYLCGASGRWFEPRESEQTVKCPRCGDAYEDGETPDGCEDPDCGMRK